MRKRKMIITVSLALSLIVFANYTVLKTAGSHPGSTGAPGELTCAQASCHTDAQVSQDFGTVNNLIYSDPNAEYIPGQSYTLTLQVTKALVSKFGFELNALEDLATTNIGTL